MSFSKREILISAVLIIVLFGYYLYSSAAWKNLDASYNPEREKLGLPIVEAYFVANKKGDAWHNPDSTLPRHALKEFSVKTQSRTIEHDVFEFLIDGKKSSLSSYYHYNNLCFNLYLHNEGQPDKKLSCAEFNSMLKENGFAFQLTKCKECDDK
jgi:hypothetical protein